MLDRLLASFGLCRLQQYAELAQYYSELHVASTDLQNAHNAYRNAAERAIKLLWAALSNSPSTLSSQDTVEISRDLGRAQGRVECVIIPFKRPTKV